MNHLCKHADIDISGVHVGHGKLGDMISCAIETLLALIAATHGTI